MIIKSAFRLVGVKGTGFVVMRLIDKDFYYDVLIIFRNGSITPFDVSQSPPNATISAEIFSIKDKIDFVVSSAECIELKKLHLLNTSFAKLYIVINKEIK